MDKSFCCGSTHHLVAPWPHDLQFYQLSGETYGETKRRLLQLPALTGRCSGRSALGGAQRTFWDTWLGEGCDPQRVLKASAMLSVNPDGWDASSPMKYHYLPYGFVWNLKDLISIPRYTQSISHHKIATTWGYTWLSVTPAYASTIAIDRLSFSPKI